MANIIQRVKAAARGFRDPEPVMILPPNAGEKKEYPLPLVWHMVAPGRYQWAMIDYEAYAREGFSQNEIVYSALKYKWDSVAQAPMRAYKGKPGVGDAELIEDENNPLCQLALRPNEFMGAIQFMQYNVLYLNLHGNAFVYFKRKPPYGLYPLRPDRVQIVPDANKRILGYLYYPDGVSSEQAFPIKAEDMLHVKTPNPYDILEGLGYGLSPLAPAARSTDTDNRMTMFLSEFFARNGIMGGGVIELPGETDIDEISKLREQFLEAYGGAAKWGKPIVIDAGGTYKPLALDFSSMELDNIDLRNMRRITAVFGVSARMLGLDSASSTDNNMQTDENAFWTRVFITELKLFEEEFAYKVRINPGEFLRYDVSGIPAFSEDVNTQVANYVQLVGNFVPPNEAAHIVGLKMPKLEGGDESYMPVSLTPVKIALNPPEPAPPSGANPFGGGNEQPADNPKPKPTDEEQAAAKAVRQGFRAFKAGLLSGYETKDSLAKSQDAIARKYESKMAATAHKQFGKDRDEVMRLYRKAQKSATKARKSFDWNDFENAVRFYLFVKGQGEWSWEFAVWFVELAWDARDDYIDRLRLREVFPTIDFDAIFLTRATIEGEAWFAVYRLQFAKAINETTYEGIHAVIRDGLEAGFGTDKIGNNIKKLFEQYMDGGTSPEDWDFMQERMPPYRVEMIARTETHGAMSAANHEFFRRTGATHKEWFATADDRTRESHLQAWNKYTEGGTPGPIPIDEVFIVGGAEMRYPGDKSGPLREFINCRCVELPYYPKED